MFTYQLQERILRTENDKEISFPNIVELEICLEPTEMFGVGDKLTKTIECGCNTNLYIDMNTGKYGFVSGHLSKPIEAIVEWSKEDIRFEMRGNMVYAKFECKNIKEFEPVLASLLYIFPTILNIELVEPPVVKTIVGRVGDARFRLIMSKSTMINYSFSTKEKQEQHIKDSFNKLQLVTIDSNRRLAAALRYYYLAKRLIEAGNFPQEFMAETILNYCKVLEILFSPSREVVKAELKKLGYSEDEIKLNFTPVMILRNKFDVGHVTLSMFRQNELNKLHDYIGRIDGDFKRLLKLVTARVTDGSYSLRLDSDLRPDNDEQKILNDLIETFEKKGKQSHEGIHHSLQNEIITLTSKKV
jgi:hypothetical protein